jgi:hypothetical protein
LPTILRVVRQIQSQNDSDAVWQDVKVVTSKALANILPEIYQLDDQIIEYGILTDNIPPKIIQVPTPVIVTSVYKHENK